MKALVVHEWFASIGGSEKVVQAMLSELPGADVFCLWRDASVILETSGEVRESIISKLPRRGRRVAALPLMPVIWNLGVPTRQYDVVVVSSHAFSHQLRVARGVPKLVYVHTPARYVWTPEFDARGSTRVAQALANVAKPVDRRRARSATAIAANSEFVRERIRAAWKLDSTVIYPPVDVALIRKRDAWQSALSPADHGILDTLPDEFVLGASRFIDYKRLDVVIEAGERSGTPVVLAGKGPSEGALRERARTASVPVTFVISPSTPLLWSLYDLARVYVFPAIEDFGIMPVEAMACGTPVVANAVGGTKESVVPGLSGSHFSIGDASSLTRALGEARTLDRAGIADYAGRFSKECFDAAFRSWIAAHTRNQTVAGGGHAVR